MAREPKSPPPVSITVPTTRSPDFKTLYVNGARTAVTPYDIRVIFSALNDNSEQEPYSEEQISIVVSPQLAKVLQELWTKAVENYEKNWGTIQRHSNALLSDETSPKAKTPKSN
ncbi:MAG: DUF3467 domain-containing protein [Acidobacteria bacterium]|nr:DUF3467 domain-containing protein [Acidobacteriota bacterium]